ncbi:unnamed protein product [Ixodes hexagonus]
MCSKVLELNDYEIAHEKMGLLEYSSDLNSEKELGRGKRKRRCALSSDYESERGSSSDRTGGDCDYLPPRPPTPTQMQKHAGDIFRAAARQSSFTVQGPAQYSPLQPNYTDGSNITPVHAVSSRATRAQEVMTAAASASPTAALESWRSPGSSLQAASLESTPPAFSGRWVPQQDDISPVHAPSTDRGSRHMGLQRSSPHGGTPR